jgi:hypothetical protein
MPNCPYCDQVLINTSFANDEIIIGNRTNPKAKGYLISCIYCKRILGILPEKDNL